ncbi:OmpA family protein [Acinetobacter sp. P1(2025)]|uniref:OmpA family protein n=1 Tax=Acinetobacter sp. P1(2025) TaxID=3446120 RepID=UPI003F534828
MKMKLLLGAMVTASLAVTGCATKQVETPELIVQTIPQPTFNQLKVFAESPVVIIPPQEQTVVCNGCDEISSGLKQEDDVIWIRVAPTQVTEQTIIDEKHFDFDKAILKGDLSKLKAIAQRLLDNPDIQVDIVGHTDSIGTQKYNQRLGQKRADAVKRWLVKQGIGAERILSASKGELEPIASNKTKAGRAKNRRAVITINVVE